jgi:hypothetical protein
VSFAKALMPTLADADVVAHDDGADERIRLNGSSAALREFERSLHPQLVGR